MNQLIRVWIAFFSIQLLCFGQFLGRALTSFCLKTNLTNQIGKIIRMPKIWIKCDQIIYLILNNVLNYYMWYEFVIISWWVNITFSSAWSKYHERIIENNILIKMKLRNSRFVDFNNYNLWFAFAIIILTTLWLERYW